MINKFYTFLIFEIIKYFFIIKLSNENILLD
jgi:hypothetical protein